MEIAKGLRAAILTSCLGGMCFMSFATAQETARRPESDEHELRQIVESVVNPWRQKYQPPGVMVVVHRAGRTEFFPFGEANRARRMAVTPDSIFELASITKVFTTTSLAIEIEEGRMKLNEPVDRYLPILRQGGDIKQVTLEELATHSSSLPREASGHRGPWNRRLVMDYLVHWRAPYPIGSKSLYSNLAVGVLGYAIAAREQAPLQEVFERQYLRPLEMNSTFFEIPERAAYRLVQGYNPAGHPIPRARVADGWPAGGRMVSSGRDMGRFLVANLGEYADRPRITKAMQYAQQPYFQASPKMMQGLAWQRTTPRGELMIDKNGGLAGTATYIGMLPGRKLGVVVLANRGKAQATSVGRDLLFKISGITPEQEPQPGAEDMDAEEPPPEAQPPQP